MGEVIENQDDMNIQIPTDLSRVNIIDPFRFMTSVAANEFSSLIILNQKIEGIKLLELWDQTSLHICADAGADRLYEYCELNQIDYKLYKPDFIVGDLDSISSNTRLKYEKLGTRVIPQLTQYASDFMKAINIVIIYYHSSQAKECLSNGPIDDHEGLNSILRQLLAQKEQDNNYKPAVINNYIINGLGGRFDQTIHSINQILKLNAQYPYLKNFFITNQDLVFLLNRGDNLIKYKEKSQFFNRRHDSGSYQNPVCGLLPLNKPVTLSTQGLKWDVMNWESRMDGNVSSSNAIASNNGVIITCDEDLFINIEMKY